MESIPITRTGVGVVDGKYCADCSYVYEIDEECGFFDVSLVPEFGDDDTDEFRYLRCPECLAQSQGPQWKDRPDKEAWWWATWPTGEPAPYEVIANSHTQELEASIPGYSRRLGFDHPVISLARWYGPIEPPAHERP